MNDIAIFSGSLIQVWAACNVGANTAWNSSMGWSGSIMSTVLYGSDSEANRILAYSGVTNSATNFLGNYYQWGRNDPVNTLSTGSILYNGSYQTGGVVLSSGSGFIVGDINYGSWTSGHLSSLSMPWTNTGTENNGPCPIGYHIPNGTVTVLTTHEYGVAYTIINSLPYIGSTCNQTSMSDRWRCILHIPLAGARFGDV